MGKTVGTFDRLVAWHQRAVKAEVPISAYLELTHTCNLRCGFCCNRKTEDHAPLALDEWRRVISELRALGTLYVTLTGGEPLAHPDFFEIASVVREQHMAIRLLTNGTLIDEGTADRIAALHPLSVELSLHGATAATHDVATGVPGSFKALWHAIDLLDERGVALALKTLITRSNAREVTDIASVAQDRGLPIRVDPKIMSRDDGDQGVVVHAVHDEDLEELYRTLHRLGVAPTVERAPAGLNCGLGHSTLAVDPNGEVFPCVLWRSSSFGMVRDHSLAEMWRCDKRQSAASVSRRANTTLIGIGGALADFPFCPAMAARHGGDPSRPYDQLRVHAEASLQARGAR